MSNLRLLSFLGLLCGICGATLLLRHSEGFFYGVGLFAVFAAGMNAANLIREFTRR